MENEEEAVGFYSGLLKEATEDGEREVLTRLIEMEKNHYDLLRWEKDSVMKMGFWADQAEFTLKGSWNRGMYDVIVVGLGPAGSIAALDLANKGLKVLALDKERFPRYKSCGGCISVKVDPIVDFDFSELIEDTVSGISFTFKSKRQIDVDSTRPIAYNVSRDRFDAFLLDKAQSAGVDIVEGTRVTSCVDKGRLCRGKYQDREIQGQLSDRR